MAQGPKMQINPENFFKHYLQAWWSFLSEEGDDPYLLVDANWEGVIVPKEYVNKDGMIVLNTRMGATSYMKLDGSYHAVELGIRFNGKHWDVIVPYRAIRSIYGIRSGMGQTFPPPEAVHQSPQEAAQGQAAAQEQPTPVKPIPPAEPDPGAPKRSHLKVVK